MMSVFNPDLTLDQKILEWDGNSKALARIKELEMAQRKELVRLMFPEPKIGTQHHALGHGYKLTFVHGYDTKLDPEAFALIQPEIEKLGAHAKLQIEEAVKYTPGLIAKGYKEMSDEVKELFNEAVVSKEKSPSLKLILPKADK